MLTRRVAVQVPDPAREGCTATRLGSAPGSSETGGQGLVPRRQRRPHLPAAGGHLGAGRDPASWGIGCAPSRSSPASTPGSPSSRDGITGQIRYGPQPSSTTFVTQHQRDHGRAPPCSASSRQPSCNVRTHPVSDYVRTQVLSATWQRRAGGHRALAATAAYFQRDPDTAGMLQLVRSDPARQLARRRVLPSLRRWSSGTPMARSDNEEFVRRARVRERASATKKPWLRSSGPASWDLGARSRGRGHDRLPGVQGRHPSTRERHHHLSWRLLRRVPSAAEISFLIAAPTIDVVRGLLASYSYAVRSRPASRERSESGRQLPERLSVSDTGPPISPPATLRDLATLPADITVFRPRATGWWQANDSRGTQAPPRDGTPGTGHLWRPPEPMRQNSGLPDQYGPTGPPRRDPRTSSLTYDEHGWI